MRWTDAVKLHLVEVAEAVGFKEHYGEEQEVIAGVDKGAAGEGAGAQADGAEDKADAVEEQDRSPGVAYLFGMHEGEGGADNQGREDLGADAPVGIAFGVEGARGAVGHPFLEPIPGGGEGGK